jgi:hypothetical protein
MLMSGDSTLTRPNAKNKIGAVPIVAASDVDKSDLTICGTAFIFLSIGFVKRIKDSVAENESKNDTSSIHSGFHISIVNEV